MDGEAGTLLIAAVRTMEEGDAQAAATLYERAWLRSEEHEPEARFWLGMNAVDAALAAGDPSRAFDATRAVYAALGSIPGVVVGNPFFHLRAGQCKYELLSPHEHESAIDDLARALIGAGIEIFDGEDARYRAATTLVLPPPVGFASWEVSRGIFQGHCRDSLVGCFGHVAGKLRERGLLPELSIFDF